MSTADYRAVIDVVGSCPRFLRPRFLRPRFLRRWENEPDLHLIKQVEQVIVLVLEGPARRFARIRRMEIR